MLLFPAMEGSLHGVGGSGRSGRAPPQSAGLGPLPGMALYVAASKQLISSHVNATPFSHERLGVFAKGATILAAMPDRHRAPLNLPHQSALSLPSSTLSLSSMCTHVFLAAARPPSASASTPLLPPAPDPSADPSGEAISMPEARRALRPAPSSSLLRANGSPFSATGLRLAGTAPAGGAAPSAAAPPPWTPISMSFIRSIDCPCSCEELSLPIIRNVRARKLFRTCLLAPPAEVDPAPESAALRAAPSL
mmetsp:Transcript_20745/g.52297  ORF Transcript_20745/g.52297 Transcript_20745/m.52297 type:complete len:250 (-) Transcript_20745:825-1574(-)